MSQALIYTLLALALVLPFVGASVLRVFFARLSEWQVVLATTVVFGVAIASVLVLARSNADSLRIGNLTLLLPVTAPQDVEVPLPTDLGVSPTRPPLPTARTTRTPTAAVTATITLTNTTALTPTVALTSTETAPAATLAATPTITPTTPATLTVVPPTLTLTATLTPTAVLADTPTAAPPPPPPTPRTYTVQPGDTLRGIAAQFNVSVADLLRVNNLTAAQADSLRPGQVLTIP